MRSASWRLSAASTIAVMLLGGSALAHGNGNGNGNEVTPRPAASVLTMVGRGFGHGRGMSQWGAYGAAAKFGLSWSQILDFYYPGTQRQELSDSLLRVWISGDSDGGTSVVPSSGLSIGSAGKSRLLPVEPSISAWRVVGGLTPSLQYKKNGKPWRAYKLGFALGPDVTFSKGAVNSRPRLARALANSVRLILPSGRQQELRGVVHSVRVDSARRTVLHTGMESYLRGVVPNEMPASWHENALAAQSVAARTYAASYRTRQRARAATWDICDTISCQVFNGVAVYSPSGRTRVAMEHPRANAAIAKTAGVVLSTGSGLANAEFSASNGGYSVASGASYIVAKPDPYDGAIPNRANAWTTTVPIAAVEARWKLGTLREIRVVGRDGRGALGGRVQDVRLVGSRRTITLTGAQLRAALGLKSDWFAFPLGSQTTR